MVAWSKSVRWSGISTVVALVVGLAVMPGSEAAVARTAPAVPELELDTALPVVESTAAETVPVSIPAGDFTLDGDAFEVPLLERGVHRKLELSVEKLNLEERVAVDRDRFWTEYEGPQGTSIMVMGDVPLNVEVDGQWEPVDETLVSTPEGWSAQRHPLAPEFSQRAAGEVVSMSDGEYAVSCRLMGAANTPGSLGRASEGAPAPLQYRDVLEGVDLKYEVDRSTVKESMVLAAPPTAAPTYDWVLSAPGLTVKPDGGGGYELFGVRNESVTG